jgi:hypothetical protein
MVYLPWVMFVTQARPSGVDAEAAEIDTTNVIAARYDFHGSSLEWVIS